MQLIAPVTDYIPASTLTTLGDMIVRGAALPERLGLTHMFHVYLSGDVVVGTGAWVDIDFDTVLYNLGGDFDIITDFRLEVTEAGYWFINLKVNLENPADGTQLQVRLDNNGFSTAVGQNVAGAAKDISASCCFAGEVETGGYVQGELRHDAGANRNMLGGNRIWTSMIGFRLPIL